MLLKCPATSENLLEVRLEGSLVLDPASARALIELLSDCPIRDQLVARVQGGEWYKMFAPDDGVNRRTLYDVVSRNTHEQYTRKQAA